MGLREPHSFPWSREAEVASDPVRLLLPDLRQLLDITYVIRLPQHQLLAKLAHLRTLTGPGQPPSLELQGMQSHIRDHLVRALFFRVTEGLLPNLADLRNRDYLDFYSSGRREKLLIALDMILGDRGLDIDLRRAVVQVRSTLLQICADEMDGE